jgi:hypothetical protein
MMIVAYPDGVEVVDDPGGLDAPCPCVLRRRLMNLGGQYPSILAAMAAGVERGAHNWRRDDNFGYWSSLGGRFYIVVIR